MRTRVRPILVLLLCGVLLLGHIPAWLHAAVCHADSCGSQESIHTDSEQNSDNQPSRSCSHCHTSCHSSEADQPLRAAAKVSNKPLAFNVDQHDGQTHDEEHCVVCQSLTGTACGLIADETRLTEVDCSHFVMVMPIGAWISDQHHIQQPRGPPVCI